MTKDEFWEEMTRGWCDIKSITFRRYGSSWKIEDTALMNIRVDEDMLHLDLCGGGLEFHKLSDYTGCDIARIEGGVFSYNLGLYDEDGFLA